MIDFQYDGNYLSDYGFMIAGITQDVTSTVIQENPRIEFKKVSRDYGKNYSVVSANYQECYTTQFEICKNPFIYDDLEISKPEYNDLMRWLNRREFLRFNFVTDDEPVNYYNAAFNIDKIEVNNHLIGLLLTMETDSPFGYGQEQTVKFDFTNTNTAKNMYDDSDEIGNIYPTVTITCKASGDLSITNEFLNCNTVIKNCKKGEVITLHGDTQIITSSDSGHDIANDFNYNFFKIGNTLKNANNPIRVSIPCEMVIKYSPIIRNAIS